MTKRKFTAEEFGSILDFQYYWSEHYAYIEQCLTDEQVLSFIKSRKAIALACDAAADYIVSQGLGEVQE